MNLTGSHVSMWAFFIFRGSLVDFYQSFSYYSFRTLFLKGGDVLGKVIGQLC